ncbi:MAG: tRNA (adenosine(37)-N6)-threonylcarbamoyltransferase complex dimerization subunit type 1 TsaB, partial [Rhodospirillaceae bacterium]
MPEAGPTILAIDTSTAACSVALWRDGAVVAARLEMLGRGHAENLMPMADVVLEEAGVAAEALTLVAVTTGPGAFTGLRLGLAAARGLTLALGVPCAGFTTTETLAAAVAAEAGEAIVAALDSKRGDFYVQVFDA